MKNLFTFLLLVMSSISSYSQIVFEKGYYINNANQKNDCLIKNIEWYNNPTEFEYKLSEDSRIIKKTIDNVKEFGITNDFRYVRCLVDMDRSSTKISEMSRNRLPEFKKEKLFLKTLITGKADLFLYKEQNLIRFFYSLEEGDLKQLVYKEYRNSQNIIVENIGFQQELLNNLICESISKRDIEYLKYQVKDLVSLFKKYNECGNSEITNYQKKVKNGDFFNLTLKAGINNSSLFIKNSSNIGSEVDFQNKISFRTGVEVEFIFKFNKNKWSVIVEPNYQSYKSEKRVRNRDVKVDYKYIQLPIGIRYYMFFNKNSKLFLNGALATNFNLNSTVGNLDVESVNNNLNLGLGYKYKNKYSLELIYATESNLLEKYVYWNSDYNNVSVVFGYTIF
ncbi:hypothetical protein A8C32_11245 [Flavivirga aquatica]|uniref:Outer membrane protein beta-barrel domain-containing protein n=1 Tax=Flavivirga aquatica TaxID=1849968 RepID=A0A1E5TD60_9FLAO|nr:porin family protein [Flavivirga aquatica]OEK09291.1 hypothetical protein A8C32_11245 [Flavivirga aquatica]